MTYEQKQQRIKEEVAMFPAVFSLRNFRGDFRVSAERSFVREDGSVALYVERDDEFLGWVPFSKTVASELFSQIVGV